MSKQFIIGVMFAVIAVHVKSRQYLWFNSAKNWNDARSHCLSIGTDLAIVESAADLSALNGAVVAAGGASGTAVWIGLNDITSEGNWVWADGTPCTLTNGRCVSFWYPGEPNDSANEDCALTWGGGTALNDGQCVSLFTYACNGSPTNTPTPAPTTDPSPAPTSNPTIAPTDVPTESPTFGSCDKRGEIKYVDWYELQNNKDDNDDQVPYTNFNMTLNENRLEMSFEIDLEYIGSSSNGDWDRRFNLGTTYVIDFQPFEINGDLINQPGNCQNRIASAFDGIANFSDFWRYSEYPYLQNNIGSISYLSYPPPSKYWRLSIDNNSCNPIRYFGLFNWYDLSECVDFNGNDLIDIIEDDKSITLFGTLYINLVSPYTMSSIDSGIYRVYQLLGKDFKISINKQNNILSSIGIDLFRTSIIGINENGNDGSFQLSILTQSADYIELINPLIISSPYGTDINIYEISTSCLISTSFTCGQIFTISINSSQVECPPASFIGTYNMGFTVNCRSGQDTVCNTFLNDNGGSSISLGVTSDFVDNECDVEIYNIIFDGFMTFYDDKNFTKIHNNSINYIIGKDRIYIQIEVNIPDDGSGNNLNIFGVKIDNVFICTAENTTDLSINLDQQNGLGGCLSNNIDADGPYDIILNGIENVIYGTEIISNGDILPNVIQFSFIPFDIGRSKMYIHTQITISLQNGQNPQRRLLLQAVQAHSHSHSHSNQIRHFINSMSISTDNTEKEEDENEQINNNISSQPSNDDSVVKYILFGGGLVVFIGFILVIFIIYYIRKKRKKQHELVKQTNTEQTATVNKKHERVGTQSNVLELNQINNTDELILFETQYNKQDVNDDDQL